MSNKISSMHHSLMDKGAQKVSESGRGAKTHSGAATTASDGASKTASTDSVVLTDRSQLLERIEKTLAAMPAIDRERVEAVKADIAEGRYEIDVDNIAEIMLRSERDFGE